MLSAYICRQCRVHLTRRAVPTPTPRWQPRARNLSLRSDHETYDTVHQGQIPSAESLETPHTSRYAALVRERAAATSHKLDPSKAVPLEEPVTGFSHVAPFERALKRGTLRGVWEVFNKIFTSRDCKALTDPSPHDVALMGDGKVFGWFLGRVNRALCSGREDLPVTPTELLLRYEQLGIARPDYWSRHTLAFLTSKAIMSANTSLVQDRQEPDLPSLLRELVSIWRLFFQCKGPTNGPPESISTEWQIPALDSLPDQFESRNFLSRMQMFHPKIPAYPELGFCAVYLYSISDAFKAIDNLHQEADPFLQFLERLLAGSHVKSVFRQLSAPFQELPQDVQKSVIEELDKVPLKAMAKLASAGVTLKTTNEATPNVTRRFIPKRPGDAGEEMGDEVSKIGSEDDSAVNLEAYFLRRIARVMLEKPSPAKLETLWNEAVHGFSAKDSNVRIPQDIYEAFLSGFLVLFNSSKSVEIWNHMIAHGVQPRQKTWTALLSGCAKAKDLKGMNGMWQRMLDTGIEPDQYAWTTRVHGLISMREVDLGIAALDEMGKKWLSAEQPPQTQGKASWNQKPKKQVKVVNNCTKPTVEVVNGAIAALVQARFINSNKRRSELIQKVLGWAKSFNIAPDVRTYNSLIQLHMSIGDYTTAFSLLRRMEASGMSGDIATYTMIIRFSFNNQQFDDLSHAEQTTRVISLLNSVEASGVELNAYIYTIAIDRLLKQYSNTEAVNAITEHMLSRNVAIGAATHTAIITHYFQQTPPNIAAVDGIVSQILNSDRIPNDRYLFDRILEGFAHHGEMGRVVNMFTRMSTHGYQPSLRVLSAVLEALTEEDDYERASQLVQAVLEGQANVVGRAQERRSFMATARRLGLIQEMQETQDDGT